VAGHMAAEGWLKPEDPGSYNAPASTMADAAVPAVTDFNSSDFHPSTNVLRYTTSPQEQSVATMTADVNLSFEAAGDSAFSPANEDAVAQFSKALDTCINGWRLGSDTIVFDSNLQELFGDLLLQYFQKSLVAMVGEPVVFNVVPTNEGLKTIVQMQTCLPQLLSQLESDVELSQMEVSENATVVPDTPPAGVQRAPRPMNCWIIFRDAMHKQLKAKHPRLSVQAICKYTIFTFS